MTEPNPTLITRRSERVLSEWIAREKRKDRLRRFLHWLPAIVFVAGILVLLSLMVPALLPDALPPCRTEDSDNCYWDAQSRSDGRGLSFVIVAGHAFYEDGSHVYWGDSE